MPEQHLLLFAENDFVLIAGDLCRIYHNGINAARIENFVPRIQSRACGMCRQRVTNRAVQRHTRVWRMWLHRDDSRTTFERSHCRKRVRMITVGRHRKCIFLTVVERLAVDLVGIDEQAAGKAAVAAGLHRHADYRAGLGIKLLLHDGADIVFQIKRGELHAVADVDKS